MALQAHLLSMALLALTRKLACNPVLPVQTMQAPTDASLAALPETPAALRVAVADMQGAHSRDWPAVRAHAPALAELVGASAGVPGRAADGRSWLCAAGGRSGGDVHGLGALDALQVGPTSIL